jgi:hypothetical protein
MFFGKMSGYLLSLVLPCLVVSICHAGLPVAYLAQLPDVPGSGCRVNDQIDPDFESRISEVSEKLGEEVTARKKFLKDAENTNSKKMQESRMNQPGYPAVDGAAMKKMTREEKKQMAARMMEEQTGITPEELKNLKNTSNEGQQGWGKALMAQMQAEKAMNPEKAMQDQKNNMNTAELAQKMADLSQKIQAPLSKFDQQESEFENDPSVKQHMQEILEEENLLAQMQATAASCKALDAQKKKIHDAQEKYCATLSPRFLAALDELRIGIKSALPDAEEMERTQAQIQQIQFNAIVPAEQYDMAGFELVQHYINKLKQAYKYDLTGGPFIPDPCDGALGR